MRHSNSHSISRSLKNYVIFSIFGAIAASTLLIADPRTLSGEPLWLKPLKFFVSSAILAATAEWIFARASASLGMLNKCRLVIAWGLAFEMLVICTQAARGVKSHFNYQSSFDAAAYVLMGLVITLVVVGATWGIFVATQKNQGLSAVERRALRWGAVIFATAAFFGNAMTRPTPSQMETMRSGASPTTIGSHFVGSEEGRTQTLPLTGWSSESGDLRVAHFFGMHALQVLILIILLMQQLKIDLNSKQSARRVGAFAATLACGWVILLAQSLLGKSVIVPSPIFTPLNGAWLLGIVLSSAWTLLSPKKAGFR